jgi:hypothetical protein
MQQFFLCKDIRTQVRLKNNLEKISMLIYFMKMYRMKKCNIFTMYTLRTCDFPFKGNQT